MSAQKPTECRKILGAAKVRLLKDYPFFGVLALSMPVIETDSVATASTEGKNIYVNPRFIEKAKDQGGLESVSGLLTHEVMHAALGHIWRVQKRDPHLFNIACDAVVNGMILQAGMKLPPGGINIRDAEEKAAETLYAELERGSYEVASQEWGDHSLWGKKSPDETQEGKTGQSEAENYGAKSVDSNGESSPAQVDMPEVSMAQAEKEQMAGEWEKRMASAAEATAGRGPLPNEIQRLIDELKSPTVDWKTALAAFLQPTPVDYSFCPPDRRFSDSDLVLPGLNEAGLENVIIAIDTSGSIDERLLTQFLSELIGIVTSHSMLKLIVAGCDEAVHFWQELEPDSLLDKSLMEKICQGGNGTDFRPVFAKVEKEGIQPAGLIYFTDLEGSFPNLEPLYPVLWVAKDKDIRNCQVPFGSVVIIGAGKNL